ncbi:hypothetical protein KY343_01145 [Candidatus Woesearchaeota archaeon]|nr:hypothetical protein [Candidatus Woesearchaeota archaeon]
MVRANNATLDSKVGSFFRRLLVAGTITLAALFGSNCTPAGQAQYSNWPRPKSFESAPEKHYDRHIDDNKNSELYNLLRFDSSCESSSYPINKIQKVLKLKKSCGASNHSSNCITASMHGLGDAPDKSILVTLRDRRLEYVIEGDDKSFLEITYDPGKGFGAEYDERGKITVLGPRLRLRHYRVKNGKVVTPVPKGGSNSSEKPIIEYIRGDRMITDWRTIENLHYFLKTNFGASILTEEEIAEVEYFSNGPERLKARIENITGKISVKVKKGEYERKEKPLLVKSALLLEYAELYRKINKRASTSEREIQKISKINEALRDKYYSLLDEYRNKGWETDPNAKLDKREQINRYLQEQAILRNLEKVKEYIGIFE